MYFHPGRKLKSMVRGSSPGYVLPLMLGLLLLGSLSTVPFLLRASGGVKGMSVMRNLDIESYSSNSGIEHARWRLQFESGFADSFSEASPTYTYIYPINNRSANITVDYIPPLPAPTLAPLPDRPQTDRVEVEYAADPTYLLAGQVTTVTMTITATNVGTSNVKFFQIGFVMPPNFTYIPGSSTGVKPGDPAIQMIDGRQQLIWEWGVPNPNLKSGESAWRTFQARAIPLEGLYFPDAWFIFEEDAIDIVYACRGTAILAEYRKYDVRSEVGRVTLKSRLGKNDFSVRILSWQW